MSCDRDPLDVYSFAERGEHDPHIAECVECRCQLAERSRLLAALPRSMATIGGDEDDAWQARVWAQIAAQREGADPVAVQAAGARLAIRPSVRRTWTTHCAMASVAAVVLALALWPKRDPEPPPALAIQDASDPRGPFVLSGAATSLRGTVQAAVVDERPRVEIVQGPQAGRASLQVGDSIRVLARQGDRIWIYREEQPVLRCWATAGGSGCSSDSAGSRAELMLTRAGEYQIAVIKALDLSELASPASFTVELANVVRQGGTYKSYDFSVH